MCVQQYGLGYDTVHCGDYGRDLPLDLAYNGQAAAFNALRSLTVVSAAFTLAAGIQGAVRLGAQQRSKPISTLTSWSLLVSVAIALGAAAAAFGLSFPLFNNYSWEFPNGQWSYTVYYAGRGSAWMTLTAGCCALCCADTGSVRRWLSHWYCTSSHTASISSA